MIPFVCNVQKTQIQTQKFRLVTAYNWGGGKWRVTTNRYKVAFWGNENVLILGLWVHNSVNIITTELYKVVSFIVYKLHLNTAVFKKINQRSHLQPSEVEVHCVIKSMVQYRVSLRTLAGTRQPALPPTNCSIVLVAGQVTSQYYLCKMQITVPTYFRGLCELTCKNSQNRT